ncbi:DUF3048 domain-containing protein [Lysinibacillus sp. 2017]|uniref:DUF3048 domain-containing protein n=1 Tax=unclassified Lysinibacillus TaxID=2636778 RepID=UPI000D528226|nr:MULTISPECIES: DUF3048 domain-containing protein [unclassified Lysinibacillus]AWE08838.1 DUF3048 domain-containing protein [Lysinibacillus sp. 2017]TGN36161.1 DUF3048 domain-containing protein [Lysinibacillus sp. S2017]
MKRKLFISAILSAAIVAGCSDKEQVEEPVVDVEEGQGEENIIVAEAGELPFVAPFTGEHIAEEVTMRPVLVTINNHPQARPQSGLAGADVVYEMLAEGDVTRFLALYQSELPETIGPIRSARDYFIDIAKGLDAFYIAHGYSPEAKSMLDKKVVDHMNGMQYDGTYFKRSSERKAPHNSYTTGENVLAGAEKVGTSLLYQKKVSYPFYDDADSVKIGIQANEVAITYSNSGSYNSHYVYDAQTNRYTRFSANVQTEDYVTKQPIELANILFFEMPHRIIDSEGRRDITITGGGNAYVFQAGTMREVKWKNADGLLIAVEEDGSEVKLVPGKTWIHFVPTSPGLASSVTYLE